MEYYSSDNGAIPKISTPDHSQSHYWNVPTNELQISCISINTGPTNNLHQHYSNNEDCMFARDIESNKQNFQPPSYNNSITKDYFMSYLPTCNMNDDINTPKFQHCNWNPESCHYIDSQGISTSTNSYQYNTEYQIPCVPLYLQHKSDHTTQYTHGLETTSNYLTTNEASNRNTIFNSKITDCFFAKYASHNYNKVSDAAMSDLQDPMAYKDIINSSCSSTPITTNDVFNCNATSPAPESFETSKLVKSESNNLSTHISLKATNSIPVNDISSETIKSISFSDRKIALLRKMATKAKQCSKILNLQNNYSIQSSNIEADRQLQISSKRDFPWMLFGVNFYHDYQQNLLLNKTEKILLLLEGNHFQDTTSSHITKKRSPITPRNSSSRFVSSFSPVALSIMNNWYAKNKDYPYPSRDTCDVIAKSGNLSIDQVKKWFANRRRRECNTRKLGQTAKDKRNCKRKALSDDIITNTKKRQCIQ